jgi:hypothetical protein
MGVVCCGVTNEDENKVIVITSSEEKKKIQIGSKHSRIKTGSGDNDFSSRALFSLVPSDEVESNLEKAKSFLENPVIDRPEHLLIDDKLKFLASPLRFWALLSELPSGNKLHEYYSQLRIPLTPEYIALFGMNITQTTIKKIDDSIDSFEVVDYSLESDRALFVIKTTTKKILVVSPKSFLILRSVKRLDNGDFIEYQKSVELTSLYSDEIFKNEVAKLKNAGQIHFGAESLEFNGADTLKKTFTTIDVNSGVGLLLIKSMMRTRFRIYNENLFRQMVEYLVKTNEFNDLMWFPQDKENRINQIFQQNLILLKESGFALDFLDAQTFEMFKSKTTKIDNEVIEVQDEEDRFDEDKNCDVDQTNNSDLLNLQSNGQQTHEPVDTENKNEECSDFIEKVETGFEEDVTNCFGKPIDQQNEILDAGNDKVDKNLIAIDSIVSQEDQSSLVPSNYETSEAPVEPLKSHIHEDVNQQHLTNGNKKKKPNKNKNKKK